MNNEYKKISNIVDQMITFFYGIQSTNIKIEIENEKTFTKIILSSNFNIKYLDTVNSLSKIFSSGRNKELEETYWGLVGKSDNFDNSDLYLISSMIDESNINIKNNTIDTIFKRLK
ncbi:MAG: hypothetical protein ACRCZK_06465 [Oscillospiraceae bacterium]